MSTGATEPGATREPRPSDWARIAGGIGIASDARKLIVAALGLVLLQAGWSLLDRAFSPASSERIGVETTLPASILLPERPGPEPIQPTGDGMAGEPSRPPLGTLLGRYFELVSDPATTLMRPFAALFATGSRGHTAAFVHAVLAAIWAAAVWGIAGGAIARIAVIQAATGEKPGAITAVRYALNQAISLIGTPLSPLVGIAILALPCAAMGLLYQIPGPIGATIAGALAFLPLIAGLVMALILLGLAAGWPLMIATVAAEGEDGFDALSRSYAYVSQRPIRYASYVLVAWLAGVLGLIVVAAFAHAVVHLTEWGLALGGPDLRVHRLFAGPAPLPGDGQPASIHGVWLGLVALLARSWIYAYFWTAASLIYLLLRRDVDGTAWHDVYAPDHDDDLFAPEPERASTIGPHLAPDDPDAPERPPTPSEPTLPEARLPIPDPQ